LVQKGCAPLEYADTINGRSDYQARIWMKMLTLCTHMVSGVSDPKGQGFKSPPGQEDTSILLPNLWPPPVKSRGQEKRSCYLIIFLTAFLYLFFIT